MNSANRHTTRTSTSLRLPARAPRLLLAAALCSASLAAGAQTAAAPEPAAPAATEASDLTIFTGLRLWSANWDSPVPTRVLALDPGTGAVVARDANDRFSSSRIMPMPFIGLRYGNWIGSLAYTARTRFGTEGLLPDDVKRDELDLTVGYYVLPQLSLHLGYKQAKVDRISPLVAGGSKTSGLLFGVSGSVPLAGSERLSLYGNFAYGLGRNKSDLPYANGDNKLDVSYRIGEVGLSYRLLAEPIGAIKQLSLSIGYRSQTVVFKKVPLGTYANMASTTPLSIQRRNAQSTTDGIVVGLVGVF